MRKKKKQDNALLKDSWTSWDNINIARISEFCAETENKDSGAELVGFKLSLHHLPTLGESVPSVK